MLITALYWLHSSARLIIYSQCFKYSPISQSLTHSQAHAIGFQISTCSHTQCFIGLFHSHWHWSLFHCCLELHFSPSNSHLYCFVSVFDLYIPSVILNTSRFTSSILLGTNFLPNGSSVVLKLPLHLFY